MNTWYTELHAAALRVETIEKRKSGAEELAMLKRLKMLPKTKVIEIILKQLIISPHDAKGEEEKAAAEFDFLPSANDLHSPTYDYVPSTHSNSSAPFSDSVVSASIIPSAPPVTSVEDLWDMCDAGDDESRLPPINVNITPSISVTHPTASPTPLPLISNGPSVCGDAPPTETNNLLIMHNKADKDIAKGKVKKSEATWSDAIRNSTLRSAYIRIRPITYSGTCHRM